MTTPPRHVPLFFQVYDFTCLWYSHTKQFKKLDRYTIAQKIFLLLLDLTVAVLRAETMPPFQKRKLLEEISPNIDIVKVLIRMSNSLDILDERAYIALQQELQEIGQMLGGWIRSLPASASAIRQTR